MERTVGVQQPVCGGPLFNVMRNHATGATRLVPVPVVEKPFNFTLHHKWTIPSPGDAAVVTQCGRAECCVCH
jgi:hypothetical protein